MSSFPDRHKTKENKRKRENKNRTCKLYGYGFLMLLQNHEKGSGSDQDTADHGFCGQFLVQKQEREENCNHDTQLVDRHDL